ncbi:MAG TPA: TIGR02265 family protein [Anaeromyxobacteraceae bacterium]|nr:TIGR02265 family protein [Anaeromyxobacteraceae bacterium]
MAGPTTAALSSRSSASSPLPLPSNPRSHPLAPVNGGASVKGTLLIARLKFVLAQGDADARRVLERLSPEDQATLHAVLLPIGWYPADLLLRLGHAAARALSLGNTRALLIEMGRFTASLNLGPRGPHRPFVREGDPHFLLANTPRLYGAQHGSGHRIYERRGPSTAVLRHFDTGEADPDDCLTTVGWLERAVATCGGREVIVVERQCRGLGAPCCEFLVEWK